MRAEPEAEQRPAAVPARPQVVSGVDHLDAQVERLQEDPGGQQGARQPGHHQFGVGPEGPRVLPGSPHALLRGGGQGAAPQQAAVGNGEEAAVQLRHHVVHRGVRAQDVEGHI